jgi:hypothetical protein
MKLEYAHSKEITFGALRGHALQSKKLSDKTQPLIAIHGWLDNLSSFMPLMQEQPNWPWLSVDLIGHGYSQWRSESSYYYFADYLCDALGSKKVLVNDIYEKGKIYLKESENVVICNINEDYEGDWYEEWEKLDLI